MKRSGFVARAVLAAALAGTASSAYAQGSDPQAVARLEAQLAAQEAAIVQLRVELERLKAPTAPPMAASTSSPANAPPQSRVVDKTICIQSANAILNWEKDPKSTADGKEPKVPEGCLNSKAGAGHKPSANRPYMAADFKAPDGSSLPEAQELATETCALEKDIDLEVAVRFQPHMIQRCDNEQLGEYIRLSDTERPRTEDPMLSPGDQPNFQPSFADEASVVSGRPLQPAGLSPKVELSNKSKASLGIYVPIYGRTTDDRICLSETEKEAVPCPAGYRSTVTLPNVEVTAPLSNGEGLLFTRTFDDTPEPGEDLRDLQTGVGVKVGFEHLRFRGVHYKTVQANLEKFINDTAIPACRQHFADLQDQGTPPEASAAQACSRERIVDWVLALKEDKTTTAGHAHARNPELVKQLHDAMWRAGEKDIPRLGFGASIGFTFDDFKYRSARSSGLGFDKDGNTVVEAIPGAGFLAGAKEARDHSHDSIAVEAHGLIYQNFERAARRRTGRFALPGLMWVPQITWKREFAFAKGSEADSCVIDPTIAAADCGKLRFEPPRKREFTELSLEARGRVVNVPYFDKIGFAPKFSYNLDLTGHTIDLPLYVVSGDKFASGIRLRHSGGLEDILGNSFDPKFEVALFFTALSFSGF